MLVRRPLERGMRIERGLHDQPSIVGSAGDSYAAIIVWNAFDEPVDGVPGVGDLVNRLRIAEGARRTVHFKLALGLEASTNVLYYANVAVGINTVRIGMVARKGILFGDSVGRAAEINRQWFMLVARGQDDRFQLRSIPHRDHDFLIFEVALLGRLREPPGFEGKKQKSDAGQKPIAFDKNHPVLTWATWSPKNGALSYQQEAVG